MNITIKVTRVNFKWHARALSEDGKVLDEMACEKRVDIGWICREMLRWQSKVGTDCPHADAARKRHVASPIGKVYYVGLDNLKEVK